VKALERTHAKDSEAHPANLGRGVLTILNVSFPGSVTLLSAFAIVAGVLILLDRV
jgi:hypothetical protein